MTDKKSLSKIPADLKQPILVEPVPAVLIAALSIKRGLQKGLYRSTHMGVGVAAIAGLQYLNTLPAGALPFAMSLAGGMATAKIVSEIAKPWRFYRDQNEHVQLLADLHNLSLSDPEILSKPVLSTGNGKVLTVQHYVDEFKKDPTNLFGAGHKPLAAIRDAAMQEAIEKAVKNMNDGGFNP